MSTTKSIGIVYQIWDDNLGTRIELAPDSDGMNGLSEIRFVDFSGSIAARIVLDKDELEKLEPLIQRRLSDIAEFESGS